MRVQKCEAGGKFPRLNKTLSAEIRISDYESPRACSLHVMEISEDGLRVNTHERWSNNTRFSLTLPLQCFGKNLPSEITLDCEVMSCKSLYGGHHVHELGFVNQNRYQTQTVRQVIDALSAFGGRLHPRFDLLMPVEMKLDPEQMSIVVIRNLSNGGLGFRSKRLLAQDTTLEFRLPIPGGQWVSGDIKVAWQSSLEGGVFEYGAAFCGISEDEKSLIDELIESEAA